jgi:hypothetical protein
MASPGQVKIASPKNLQQQQQPIQRAVAKANEASSSNSQFSKY